MICIGELNKPLVIETPVASADGAGGSDINWTQFTSVWAKLRPRHGREKLRAEAIASNTSHIITIRYLEGLHPQMRFVEYSGDEARFFDILSIINVDEKDKWLSCLCGIKSV